MGHRYTQAVFEASLAMVEKAVLNGLAHRADNNTGVCWPGMSTIAKDVGCSYDTVIRTIPKLIQIGVVKITGQRASRSGPTNEYTLDLKAIESLKPPRRSELVAQESQYQPKASGGSELGVVVALSVPSGGSEPTKPITEQSEKTVNQFGSVSVERDSSFSGFNQLSAEQSSETKTSQKNKNGQTNQRQTVPVVSIGPSEGSSTNKLASVRALVDVYEAARRVGYEYGEAQDASTLFWKIAASRNGTWDPIKLGCEIVWAYTKSNHWKTELKATVKCLESALPEIGKQYDKYYERGKKPHKLIKDLEDLKHYAGVRKEKPLNERVMKDEDWENL